jgi:hypothetical protein
MGEKRTHKVSPEGHAAMAATGTRNILAWHSAREARQQRQETIMEASMRFQSGLAEEIGETSASQEALIVSATTCYTALFGVLDRLRTTRNAKQITALTAQLRPLQSGLLRTLQALGVAKGMDGDDTSNGDQRNLGERITQGWQAARKQAASDDEEGADGGEAG